MSRSFSKSYPEMPPGIVDRAADVWEPLLAIADVVGGDWSKLARACAVTLDQERSQGEPSWGVRLLTDIWRVFGAKKIDRLRSNDLVMYLVADERVALG